MATEKDIRDAIAARVQTAAPTAVVVPRNILGIRNNGWLGLLQSPDDSQKIHGWMVSQQAQPLRERRQTGAQHDLVYHVWQFYEYRTGDNTSNSEDEASAEREAVILTFAPANLPSPLSWAEPLEFLDIDLFSIGDRMMHIAKGRLAVTQNAGCA